MNSSYGKPNNKSSASANAFDFDLGLGSGRPRPINDQKNPTPSYSQRPNTSQPNKPAWTHQPAAPVQSGMAGSLSGPASMVGDIFGKSWNSSSSSSVSGVGIVNNKNPNLFGDLLNSALGQNKSSSSNVPLKNAAPVPSQSAFSMGNMADSLPKSGYSGSSSGGSVNVGGNYGKNSSLGGNYGKSSGIGGSGGGGGSVNLGGPSMRSMTGNGVGVGGMGSGKDPFGSLVDFSSSKPAGSMNSAAKVKPSDNAGLGDDLFGGFQNATSKTSGSSFSTSDFPSTNSTSDPLGGFGFSSSVSDSQTQPSKQQPSGANDFDALFSSSSAGGGGEFTSQQFTEVDDWGVNSDFGGGNDNGGTTELEGLPPPPVGVFAPSAKNKGMENYKQGQFADAIKWLSWAVVLLEKGGDDDGTMEVLTCRASCYKEVGEYKKAVADCTKVLQHDGKNVSVLVQRALLYESMEKYKLGAEDLRTVMKIDPGNRVARSTVHRLAKMAE